VSNLPIEVRRIAPGDPLSVPVLSQELSRRYLIFDAYVAGARRVELHPLLLSQATHDGAVRAAEGVAAVVGQVAMRAHGDAAERARYGLGEDSMRLAAASYRAGDRASLVRVDLLLGDDGEWRACEINADCPGGHNESLALPRLARAAGFSRGTDPTTMLGGLATRLAALARRPDERPGVVALLHATAYAEDMQVCAIVQRALERVGVRGVLASPMALRFESGDLHLGADVVRVLYRYFPTEYMEGQANIDGICRAVCDGRVRSLSSFAHIYAQSKLSFARAWALEASLEGDHRATIRRHVPPSFDLATMSREGLIAEQGDWVVKRALGRVGDEVFVGPLLAQDEWIAVVDGAHSLCAAGDVWVAQRFVVQRALPTPWGDRYVTLGAYVLDGRFAGYFARITPESHVSHGALCVPVFTGDA
jgi:glutathionylspermidine synthase